MTQTVLSKYQCEVCDVVAELTEVEALDAGWDYPPFIGMWGVLSPRTCPDCSVGDTVWWHVITTGGVDNLSERHMNTVERIMKEREEHGKSEL